MQPNQDIKNLKGRDLSILDWEILNVNRDFLEILVDFSSTEDVSEGGNDFEDNIIVEVLDPRVFSFENIKIVDMESDSEIVVKPIFD
jgi:hypothetical protein